MKNSSNNQPSTDRRTDRNEDFWTELRKPHNELVQSIERKTQESRQRLNEWKREHGL